MAVVEKTMHRIDCEEKAAKVILKAILILAILTDERYYMI